MGTQGALPSDKAAAGIRAMGLFSLGVVLFCLGTVLERLRSFLTLSLHPGDPQQEIHDTYGGSGEVGTQW